MNPKGFVEALVRAAGSDAADNKPKRDADNEQSYCATRLSLLVTDMISSRESEPEREEFR
jgi:hypothetical protein